MTMSRKLLVIAASFTLSLWSVAVGESTAVLLEKGIYAEETLGDLDQAIQIYGRIAAKTKAERPIAAQAQFRQARCLLQKGDQTRAAEGFRAVISQYADQQDLVAEAEKLLGASARPARTRRPWWTRSPRRSTMPCPPL